MLYSFYKLCLMAWIYLAESEELQSPCKNGLDLSRIAKSIPIVKQFFSHRWLKDHYLSRQSGMMLIPFQGNLCAISSISSMEVSHARTSVLHPMEKGWMESEAGCFSRLLDWPKRSSPSSYSLKMSQPSLDEGVFESLEKLPKWGMIVDGVLYPLHPLVLHTKEIGGFCWQDTDENKIREYIPTPMANNLPVSKRAKEIHTSGPRKMDFVRMWPTPDASTRGAYKSQEKRIGHHFTIQDAVGSGKLNPVWIEWLMGYRKGWTELEPWATQWFQVKQKKRSRF